PESVHSISAGIAALLDNQRAANLRTAAYARATQFSWEHSAAAIIALYDQACTRLARGQD
ncbi:glycosyltransferase family 4 protein, partial [Candidatus Gracilibacteria bacterium]|nr:glycosyltransferase family 4 protein [Candidatus Gracilibacteria bacterium]